MKRTIYIVTAMFALCSCVRDVFDRTEDIPGKDEKRVLFNMTLPATSATRSITGGDENTLERMDVLAFKVEADGVTETFDYYTVGAKRNDNVGGTVNQKFEVVVKIRPYRQRFVIIANAQDRVQKLYASSQWTGMEKWSMLQRLTLSLDNPGDKWNAAGSSDYTPLPMFGQSGQVMVDNSLTRISDAMLHRMVARINVNLKNDATLRGKFKLKSVHLYNTNDRGHIVPSPAAIHWDAGRDYVVSPTVPIDARRHTGPIVYNDFDAGSVDVAMNNSIYLFETEAQPSKPLEQTCVVVGGRYGTDTKESYYRIDLKKADGGFMHVLRNHNYELQIVSVDGPGSETPDDAFRGNSALLTATVKEWDLADQKVISDDQYYLRVNEDSFGYTKVGGRSRLTAETDYTISSQGFPAGIWVREEDIEYDPAVNPGNRWLTLTDIGASWDGAAGREVEIKAYPNPTASVRSAKVHVKAGNLTKVINISQEPYSPYENQMVCMRTYVGAFWRADQTGERLIRMYNVPLASAGDWTAQVLEYGDFAPGDIVFSAGLSADGSVWTPSQNTDMNDPAVDAVFGVGGIQQVVGGTVAQDGEIFFRVGLKSKWSTDPNYNSVNKPVRYAVIGVWHNDNKKMQRLYIRQGHGADYLMRPNDPDDNNAAIDNNRSNAKKFISYNLTHPDLKKGAKPGGTNINDHPMVPLRATLTEAVAPDYFTDYPSQAGAFFMWASTDHPRRAYHPTNPVAGITGWSNRFPTQFWSNLNITQETCPPGYRRPNDGSSSVNNGAGNVANSEIRQSLWLNPLPGDGDPADENSNDMWGYYADGFFDRRLIVSSPTGIPESTVERNTHRAAYQGQLFFNPYTNASLFFPAAGHRNEDKLTGNLASAGSNGYYWTSSTAWLNTSGWRLDISFGHARQLFTDRFNGNSIRCVKE